MVIIITSFFINNYYGFLTSYISNINSSTDFIILVSLNLSSTYRNVVIDNSEDYIIIICPT